MVLGRGEALPLIPKALPILKLKRWLLCRLWFPGISSAGIYSRSRSLPAGWLALMGTEQAAGEDEEGSPPWGMVGSPAVLTASL